MKRIARVSCATLFLAFLAGCVTSGALENAAPKISGSVDVGVEKRVK